MDVTVVQAGLRGPSSTHRLAGRLASAVTDHAEATGTPVTVRHVDLVRHAQALVDRLVDGTVDPRLEEDLAAVTAADAVVLVTPVYAASLSSLFKLFVDVLPPGSLDGTPVLAAATGGSMRHALVLDHALRPVLAHHRAATVATAVFAAPEDWRPPQSAALDERIDRAAAELLAAAAARPVAEPAGAGVPWLGRMGA